MLEMEDMAARCPTSLSAHGFQCELYNIGQSFEGRDMKVLRVREIAPNLIHWFEIHLIPIMQKSNAWNDTIFRYIKMIIALSIGLIH